MRGLAGSIWRARYYAALALAVLGLMVVVVASASADAGNPILGTIGGSVVVNYTYDANHNLTCNLNSAPYCTVTVYVRGQWNWYSHNSDCNTDRAGAGVGIIWNDPTETGWTVSKGSISQQIGIKTPRANDPNPIDEMVHPSDIGNVAEGYPGLAGQKFSNPTPAGITATQVANWFGGCGREPLTATVSPGPNAAANPSGKPCADGTTDCSGHPWGSWGYSVNGGLGYSHTYAKAGDISNVCVNYYDVHGGGKVGDKSFQVPNGTKEITVDGNGDNSIQTNSFDAAQGANCYSFVNQIASIDITKSPKAQTVQSGSTATFTITVTNNGAATLTNVRVTDPLSPSCAKTKADIAALATMAPGASVTFACTLANVTSSFTNVATALGTPPLGPDVSDTDNAQVNVNQAQPAISITKNPKNQSVAPGGTATFQITVTNTGNVNLLNVHVDDPLSPDCTKTKADLASLATLTPNSSVSYSCTKTGVNAAFTNVATVTGSPQGGGSDVTAQDTAQVTLNQPAIDITKGPKTQPVASGGTATFSIAVKNTGVVTLLNVHVDDPLSPNCTKTKNDVAGFASLAPGATITYNCTLAGVTASFTNVATVTGTPQGGGNDVTDTDTAPVTVNAPSIDIIKSPKTQTIPNGGTASFTITAINTGSVTLTNVHIDDAKSPGCARTKNDLQTLASFGPGSSVTYTCTLANVTSSFTNVAIVTGTPQGGGADVTDTDSADVTVVQPSITISKTPKTQQINKGDSANFTITVTNNGPVTLLNVHVDDQLSTDCAKTKANIAAFASLAPGQTQTYTCSQPNVQSAFTNVAVVTGSPQGGGPDVTATDNAEVTIKPSGGGGGGGTPAISITKNPKQQTINSGNAANFTITVTNTGTVALTNVTIVDPLAPDCSKTGAGIPDLLSMGPGVSVTYNCSLQNVTSSFTNVATASGTGNGQTVTATDTAPVTVTPPLTPPPTPTPPKPTPPPAPKPSITIAKDPATQTVGKGGTATFKITVRNNGNAVLKNVTVSDPLSPECNRALGTLAVGEAKHYTCTRKNVSADFMNVATATGKPPTGPAVKASDNAQVKVAPFIPPKKPNTPRISISKTPKQQVLTTKIKTGSGGATSTTVTYGTAHFTIKVTNTGNVALHKVTVTDPETSSCSHTIGTLTPGQTISYPCERNAVQRDFRNVATVTAVSPSGQKVKAVDHADVKVAVKTSGTSGANFTG